MNTGSKLTAKERLETLRARWVRWERHVGRCPGDDELIALCREALLRKRAALFFKLVYDWPIQTIIELSEFVEPPKAERPKRRAPRSMEERYPDED